MGTPVLDESVHDTPVVCDNSSETKQDEATSEIGEFGFWGRRGLARILRTGYAKNNGYVKIYEKS